MSDPCCALCKSVPGVCLSRYQCEHHKQAEAQADANHAARQTIRDPTAARAIRNVMAARRRNPKRPRT